MTGSFYRCLTGIKIWFSPLPNTFTNAKGQPPCGAGPFLERSLLNRNLDGYANFRLQIPIPANPAPSSSKEVGSGTSPAFVMTVCEIFPAGLHVPFMGFSEQPYPKIYEPVPTFVPTVIGVLVSPALY